MCCLKNTCVCVYMCVFLYVLTSLWAYANKQEHKPPMDGLFKPAKYNNNRLRHYLLDKFLQIDYTTPSGGEICKQRKRLYQSNKFKWSSTHFSRAQKGNKTFAKCHCIKSFPFVNKITYKYNNYTQQLFAGTNIRLDTENFDTINVKTETLSKFH